MDLPSFLIRDSGATTLFMIGTTMGEAIMPAVFGYCMKYLGPNSLPWMVSVCCILLIGVYINVDCLGKQANRTDTTTIPTKEEQEDG